MIVRRVKRLTPAHTAGQQELFDLWRHHAVFVTSGFEMLQAEVLIAKRARPTRAATGLSALQRRSRHPLTTVFAFIPGQGAQRAGQHPPRRTR